MLIRILIGDGPGARFISPTIPKNSAQAMPMPSAHHCSRLITGMSSGMRRTQPLRPIRKPISIVVVICT